MYWTLYKAVLKSVGRLSQGVQLGWRRGFDSGESLDYVYENRARGITPLGRWIDRQYLNSIGWRCIRQRKIHVETLLRKCIGNVHSEGKPVRLLDIATGVGRYVLETLAQAPEIEVSALLRDRDPLNLAAARQRAEEMKLPGVIFAAGDAFDRAGLAAIRPHPNIAIVSGLYELFPDNQMIARSLAGLAGTVENGGYLIYTNQPWHPQLEMIARVLVNRDGKPWVMRCRAQAEMDELVRAAGFEKEEMLSDEYGIFTVSVARRVPGRLGPAD